MTRTLALALVLFPLAATAQPVAPVSRSAAPRPGADARAERLVAAWAAGNTAPTVAAFPDALRAAGAETVPHLVRTLGRRHGALAAVAAEGTTLRPDGRAETVVALRYARGAERLRLTWNADGSLRTLARAPRAVTLAAVR